MVVTFVFMLLGIQSLQSFIEHIVFSELGNFLFEELSDLFVIGNEHETPVGFRVSFVEPKQAVGFESWEVEIN